MTSSGNDRNRITELFDAAVLQDRHKRGQFLARACAGNQALLAELKSLVAEYEQLGDSNGSELTGTLPPDQLIGQRLGDYEIRFEIDSKISRLD